MTHPSSMYPRVVSMVGKAQSAVRDASISKHGLVISITMYSSYICDST